jgi:hypothetical protein
MGVSKFRNISLPELLGDTPKFWSSGELCQISDDGLAVLIAANYIRNRRECLIT